VEKSYRGGYSLMGWTPAFLINPSHNIKKKKKKKTGTEKMSVKPAFDPSTQTADLWIQGQPGLQNKFQDRTQGNRISRKEQTKEQ
jgi:hypothetical protein